jgi:hypothetical protein
LVYAEKARLIAGKGAIRFCPCLACLIESHSRYSRRHLSVLLCPSWLALRSRHIAARPGSLIRQSVRGFPSYLTNRLLRSIHSAIKLTDPRYLRL